MRAIVHVDPTAVHHNTPAIVVRVDGQPRTQHRQVVLTDADGMAVATLTQHDAADALGVKVWFEIDSDDLVLDP